MCVFDYFFWVSLVFRWKSTKLYFVICNGARMHIYIFIFYFTPKVLVAAAATATMYALQFKSLHTYFCTELCSQYLRSAPCLDFGNASDTHKMVYHEESVHKVSVWNRYSTLLIMFFFWYILHSCTLCRFPAIHIGRRPSSIYAMFFVIIKCKSLFCSLNPNTIFEPFVVSRRGIWCCCASYRNCVESEYIYNQ